MKTLRVLVELICPELGEEGISPIESVRQATNNFEYNICEFASSIKVLSAEEALLPDKFLEDMSLEGFLRFATTDRYGNPCVNKEDILSLLQKIDGFPEFDVKAHLLRNLL